VLAEVAKAGPADVDAALAAAHRAFADGRGAWARTNATERGRVLHRVAALIREREDLLATAEARGAGHPIGDARWEVGAAAGTFEYYAGAANKHFGSVVPVQDAGLDVVLREPVGPVALIVPWNFPLLIACWKLAPALACGNPVVLKPASLTPLTALLWATSSSTPASRPTRSTCCPGRVASSATPW
jgi:acyl-CoA reductase-like NAD-dependent aldehyde dehydrogenase